MDSKGTHFRWVGDPESGHAIASRTFEKEGSESREWQKHLGLEGIDRLPPEGGEGVRLVGRVTSEAGIREAKEELDMKVSSHYPAG